MLRPEVVRARKLRREMSLPEVLLWQRLRGGRAGVRFRRQHPIGPYVVDFYCCEAKLVIEIDGQAHATPDRARRDATRDEFLRENGNEVLHVNASEILSDADSSAAAIARLVARPLHQPAAGPPPRAGEDL